MKLFWIIFLVFFIFYSFFGEVKITYVYSNERKEEKIATFLQSLFVVIVLSMLSSGFISLFIIGFLKIINLLF